MTADADGGIVVAALTYRRPDTLRRLLDALAALELPAADVRFVIVDNDAAASARATVDACTPRFAGRLHYVVEPRPGIPAARNRALHEAAAGGAAVLCFTDDDAYPQPSWLRELLACRAATGAVLVLGPVRLVAPRGLRGWRRVFAASLVARARFIARYAATQARRGRIVTSATSNWLGDVRWIEAHGLRFDEARAAGGGEDTAFFDAVGALGGRRAWCEHAVVNEGLPPDRVSVAYQYRRARANGINSAQLGRSARLLVLRHPIGRMVAGLALMALPVLGIASFALGLHAFGSGVGMRRAARGARSDLYSRER